MRNEKSQKLLKIFFGVFIFFGTLYGIVRGLEAGVLMQFVYFTIQSNILVLAVTIMMFTKAKEKKWFKYLAFVALVDILLTGVIFNTLLSSFWKFDIWLTQGLGSFFHHLFVPVAFTALYFMTDYRPLRFRDFWVSIIHPLVYFATFLFIVEPLTGFSPYPFMSAQASSMGKVLVSCVGFILPAFLVISVLLIFLKKLTEKRYEVEILTHHDS